MLDKSSIYGDKMKKFLAVFVIFSLLFLMAACQSEISNTKVRVVNLSYNTSNQALVSIPSNTSITLLSKPFLANDVEDYVFPGDILTFSIELEDPNFELISILSIQFNGQIIRANVDNSIVTTRDCGANICVDFPFKIAEEKSEYTVQEVKFAKLNSDTGISAIIDRNSQKSLSIDVYRDELSPYLVSSVETINQLLKSFTFFSNDYLNNEITMSEINSIMLFNTSKMLTIKNIEDSPTLTEEYKNSGWWGYEFGPLFNRIFPENNITYGSAISIFIEPTVGIGWINGEEIEIDISQPYLRLILPYDEFDDAQAFHVGNDIFIKIAGIDYFIITLSRKARIVEFEYSLHNS